MNKIIVIMLSLFATTTAIAAEPLKLAFLLYGSSYSLTRTTDERIVGEMNGFNIATKRSPVKLKKNKKGEWSGKFGPRMISSRYLNSSKDTFEVCLNDKNHCAEFVYEAKNGGLIVNGLSKDGLYKIMTGFFEDTSGWGVSTSISDATSDSEVAYMTLIETGKTVYQGGAKYRAHPIHSLAYLSFGEETNLLSLQKLTTDPILFSILYFAPLGFNL